MGGAVETITPNNDADHWDLIEGQGSLFHPSYSGVTMALIHGGAPDHLILCHEPTRTHMRGLPHYGLPTLEQLRDTALPLAQVSNPECKVVGISVNTQHLTEEEAKASAAERKALHHLKCGKCGGDMHPKLFKGVEIDICETCGAVLLDPGELEELAGEDGSGVLSSIGDLFQFTRRGK